VIKKKKLSKRAKAKRLFNIRVHPRILVVPPKLMLYNTLGPLQRVRVTLILCIFSPVCLYKRKKEEKRVKREKQGKKREGKIKKERG